MHTGGKTLGLSAGPKVMLCLMFCSGFSLYNVVETVATFQLLHEATE